MRGIAAMAAIGLGTLALAGCGGGDTTTVTETVGGGGSDPCAGAPADLGFVFVTRPVPGERVTSGFALEGCARSFEGNVPWRLVDAQGRELVRGAATGGSVDGPQPFRAEVSYGVGEQQVALLEVQEDDPSGGEGRPPVRNVIPVVLSPTGP
jgi:hypothetical protein